MLAFLVAAVGLGIAQARGGPVACEGCVIHRTLVTTLGADNDSVLLGTSGTPLRTSDGRYLAMPDDKSRLVVFDSTGKLTGTVGRPGQGPGEFSFVRGIALGPGDSLYVFESLRIDVFTPRLAFARSIPVPKPAQNVSKLLPLRSGILVALAMQRDARDFIHVIGPTGERRASFGGSILPVEECSWCGSRVITPAPEGDKFITLPPHDYTIEHWTAEGAVRRVSVESSWFPRETVRPERPGTRPSPVLVGITSDSAGHVWVIRCS
jgi:hypothetical protein